MIVLLVAAEEEELAWRGTDAGAVGFVRKDLELAALPRIVRSAAAGEAAISRVGLRHLLDRLRHGPGGIGHGGD